MAPEPPTALNPIEPAGGADLPEVETETRAHFEAPSLSAAPSEGIAPEGPRAAPERLTAAHFPHRLEELRSELLEQGKERHLVSLELEPEHLGKVRVSLSCEPASEKVRALLSVTSGETARVLDKALSSAGTDGLAISIEIGSGTSEGRGWADSPTRPPLPPRRTESPSEATLASLVEPTPRVAPRGLYAWITTWYLENSMAVNSATSAPSAASTATSSSKNTADSIAEARQHGDFLKLFLAQVTQQDPLEPMKNAELMQQVIGIETIERLGQLDEGLQALAKVDLAQGASLIGKTVKVANSEVTGRVDRVLFRNGQTLMVVGGKELPLSSIESLEAGNASSANG
jgi:flagellar basal-body rod modification protein FlgD